MPADCIVLTLACGKFRFFDKDLGAIGGIPRLLDMGQCNDAYSAIQIAVALSKAFGVGVNDLPLSMILSWYEQKAVAILLTLLSLGIKDIRLGPSLPAFITPNVLDVLVENFGIKPITTPDAGPEGHPRLIGSRSVVGESPGDFTLEAGHASAIPADVELQKGGGLCHPPASYKTRLKPSISLWLGPSAPLPGASGSSPAFSACGPVPFSVRSSCAAHNTSSIFLSSTHHCPLRPDDVHGVDRGRLQRRVDPRQDAGGDRRGKGRQEPQDRDADRIT